MRLFELQENYESFEQAWEEVKHNCSTILSEYQRAGRVFYRGTGHHGRKKADIFKDSPRTDRRPRDAETVKHNLCNYLMHIKGSDVNRSNHYAAISSAGSSSFYGHPYVVFPFNGFKFLFSAQYADFGTLIGRISIHALTNFARTNGIALNLETLKDYQPDDNRTDSLYSYLSAYDVTEETRMAFYKANPELMSKYADYIWEVGAIRGSNADDLYTALEKEHEVMFAGTDYLAFKLSTYKDELEHQLGFELKEIMP